MFIRGILFPGPSYRLGEEKKVIAESGKGGEKTSPLRTRKNQKNAVFSVPSGREKGKTGVKVGARQARKQPSPSIKAKWDSDSIGET